MPAPLLKEKLQKRSGPAPCPLPPAAPEVGLSCPCCPQALREPLVGVQVGGGSPSGRVGWGGAGRQVRCEERQCCRLGSEGAPRPLECGSPSVQSPPQRPGDQEVSTPPHPPRATRGAVRK